MPTTQLSGLASGFDWSSYVDQIMDIEQTVISGYESKQRTAKLQVSALESLSEMLETLQDKSDDLRLGTSDYYARSIDLKTPDDQEGPVGVSADGTTPLGTYDIEILQVATQSEIQGAKASAAISDTSATLASLQISTTIQEGDFTVNGASVEIETTDTLQDVFDKISTATGGNITAALVDDRIELTSGNGDRIVLGAASDTSNFLEAMRLYTDTSETPLATISSSSTLGATNVNVLMSDAIDTGSLTGLTDGAGSVVINGETINFNINSDSIRSLMTEINESGAGVLINYDPGSDSFTMTSNDTGSLDVVLDDPNGLLEKLGLTTGAGASITYGKNAQFTIDGGTTTITSASNVLEESAHGIPGLEIVAQDVGTETIKVEANVDNAKSRVEDFINAYNAFAIAVDDLVDIQVSADGEISKGALAGNREVSQWKSQLRSLIFNSVDTGNQEISRIFHLGIDFDDEGQLSIEDEDALNDALEADPSAVAQLFNNSDEGNKGIANLIYDYIEDVLAVDGTYDVQVDTLNKKIDDLDDDIDDQERYMEREQERLTASFVAMEQAQSQISNDLQMMQSILGLS